MKIIFRIIRPLVLAVLTPDSFTASNLAQEIIIPDPNLNAVVRETLQKPSGPLTIGYVRADEPERHLLEHNNRPGAGSGSKSGIAGSPGQPAHEWSLVSQISLRAGSIFGGIIDEFGPRPFG
jgi:hypothetical protein